VEWFRPTRPSPRPSAHRLAGFEGEIARVDDELVHRDPADHRHPHAADEHACLFRCDPGNAVGVPEWDQRDGGVLLGDVVVAVRDAFAGADPAYLGDLAD
jgi:hypothetical protein